MKRVFALLLTVTLFITMSTVGALADTSEMEVASGAEIIVYGFTDKDGTWVDDYSFSSDDYAVSYSMSKGTTFVDKVYFKDGSVYLKTKSGILGEKKIEGHVRVTYKESREKYIADVNITLNGAPDARMGTSGDGYFDMPSSFQSQRVKFVTSTGEKVGTFIANFTNDRGLPKARFSVKVIDQQPLFLGFTEPLPDINLVKKNEGADIRCISWTATPKFDSRGTLGIEMKPTEYLYSVGADGALTYISGKYNSGDGRLEFKTDTLGTYLISSKKLVGATSAAKPTGTASSAPASSSSAASKPASSVAPASSSSQVSSSSEVSISSSEPESSSSEPSSIFESSTVPSSSSTNATVEEPTTGSNKWVIPTIIAVVVILIGVVLYFVLGKKKKNYDSWDE